MSVSNTRWTRSVAPADSFGDGTQALSRRRSGYQKSPPEKAGFNGIGSRGTVRYEFAGSVVGYLCERRPDSGWESTRDSETLHSVVGKQP
jgi:hypothetical protein